MFLKECGLVLCSWVHSPTSFSKLNWHRYHHVTKCCSLVIISGHITPISVQRWIATEIGCGRKLLYLLKLNLLILKLSLPYVNFSQGPSVNIHALKLLQKKKIHKRLSKIHNWTVKINRIKK